MQGKLVPNTTSAPQARCRRAGKPLGLRNCAQPLERSAVGALQAPVLCTTYFRERTRISGATSSPETQLMENGYEQSCHAN